MTRARWSVVLTLLMLAGLAAPAAAAAPTWSAAARVGLPSGASGLNQGFMPALSCANATNCATAGSYLDAAGDPTGMVVNEVNGSWQRAQAIVAPSGAAPSPSLTPYSISCASPGNCAVVGSYLDATNNIQAFVANEVNGTWRSAQEVTLPADATTSGQNATLRAVVCSANGACSAVGMYLNNQSPNAATEPLAVSERGGTWGAGVGVALPAGANVNPLTGLDLLACSSTANCTGTGSYVDANNVHQGLLINESNGQWSASDLLAPANASAYALAQVSSITCVANGACSAIGTYETANGLAEGFTVSGRSGRWARAMMMRMPVPSGVNPHVFFYGYGGIACANASNCATGGQYRDATGAYQAFVLSEVKGVWGIARKVALPAGSVAGANGGVVAMSCPAAGACRAGAAYLDPSGHYQALLLSQVNGAWKTSTVSLPGGASQVGVAGGVYAIECTSASCTATGSYLAGTATYQGFVVTSQ